MNKKVNDFFIKMNSVSNTTSSYKATNPSKLASNKKDKPLKKMITFKTKPKHSESDRQVLIGRLKEIADKQKLAALNQTKKPQLNIKSTNPISIQLPQVKGKTVTKPTKIATVVKAKQIKRPIDASVKAITKPKVLIVPRNMVQFANMPKFCDVVAIP